MKTSSKKLRYTLLFGIIAVLTVILACMMFIGARFYYANAASGNSAFPQDEHEDFELVMDVNGDDASRAPETAATAIDEANKVARRVRVLSVNAILEKYREQADNGVGSSYKDLYDNRNFYIASSDETSPIYNSFKQYVNVEKNTFTGQEVQTLKFTALKYKESSASFIVGIPFLKKGNNPNLPDNITVYVKFTINSTFAPASSDTVDAGAATVFYLTDDLGNDSRPIELINNTTTLFDVSSIVGQKLSYGTSYTTAVPLHERVSDTSDWVINDVSCFTVETDASSPSVGSIIRPADIKISGNVADGVSTPTLIINTHFTENQVISQGGADFWITPKFLTFKLTDRMGMQTVTVAKRVVFSSIGAPVLKSTFVMDKALNLNFSSKYQFVDRNKYTLQNEKDDGITVESNSDVTSEGYSQVRVKPSYLCEFPSEGRQYFDAALTEENITISPSTVVDLEIVYAKNADGTEDRSTVDYYLIRAVNSGSAVVNFKISYTIDSAGTYGGEVTVPVVFNVYGQHKVDPYQMKGKKPVLFSTVSSDYFKPLVDSDFYMNSANVAEGSTELLQVKFERNELTLTPLASGEATIKLGFMDLQGNQIYLDWKISINYNGGTIFAYWDTYQLVLFFIGIGLAALAVILLLVWLFIRGISKRRQEENETTAPTSAYIIKLNSTIAAAQAQQRVVTSQTFNTAQTQMLALGAGPTTTSAPNPDTLQLTAGVPNQQTSADGNIGEDTVNSTASSNKEEIYIPLSDDELLERIFVEKYEPRGMARRSFFKSKDLQSRELEKEKARIRDDVRDGMTIEEACKSLSERQSARTDTAVVSDGAQEAAQTNEDSITVILGFDPASPLLEEEEPAAAEENPDALPEEVALNAVERKLARLEKELAVLNDRLSKTQQQLEKAQGAVDETNNTLQMKEESNAALRKSIEDLEFRMATARGKEKDKLLKDIENKENVIASNKDLMQKLQDELERKKSNLDAINAVLADYSNRQQLSEEEHQKLLAEAEEARENYRLAQELMEKAKKAQETRDKRERLRPFLETVNTLDYEIRSITDKTERDNKEKDTFKAEVTDLQKQMLSTSDPAVIGELSASMTELNRKVSDLDKAIAQANKDKADKTIKLNGERRKANEFIDKEELEVDDVVAEEDDVIGKMAFDEYMQNAQQEREAAEKLLADLQAQYEELVSGYDSEVMDIAVRTAASIKEAEDAVAETQTAVDELNAKIETASDDEKLMLSIDQMSLNEQLEQNKKVLGELQAAAAKEKLEHQMQYDSKLEDTKKQIEEAQASYEQASAKVDESMNKINPLDLILSGSGLISQDRKRMEAENLKKQLELTKSAMEQAKLQAKMAQMDADKAIIDAQRASEESKQEAERVAQEAIARAEEARIAAEQKAAEDAEQIRLEMEKVKQEAEEEKRRLAEDAEQAKREAEEARIAAEQKAAEEAERAKREAEEEAERARKEAEEEVERARKAAEEEAERARKAAEEEAERAKEEAERAKREAEEQAERDKAAKEAEDKRIKEKIEKKKAHILEMRAELKDVTDEASAKALKEKFYNEQVKLDEDEKSTPELTDLINKCMSDADHAAEVSMYKALANKAPKRVVKKVTERINKIPRKKPGAARSGARPSGARPTRPGARPSGARPTRPGARPSGARPTRPGARPSGTRPTRPNGSRPRK